ncbi:squamosa promoter-binding-like protein 12 [Phoenix dactylifera]|uniref:Squamosa promoter-binding-like protein 12 n=1 Tax=Phoenix dactylifera TaxID=42345 RepID=A0A8B7CYD6_PHODC|nr:squamosa promoter-binding-like protein 12 [Phoenix dactylifera]
MDWNAKATLQWDWEHLTIFGGKESKLSGPAQQHEWKVEGAGGIGDATLYSSSRGACSGSELGNDSSRSSISASMCSSSKAAIKVPEFNFEPVEGFPKNLSKSKELARGEDTGTSPVAMAKVGPGEPPIGLKLGKRTYFEDIYAGNSIKNPSASSVMPSTGSVKRTRVSHQSIRTTYCQVEGCNIDLTAAKDYHRKHRVCESHSRSPKVLLAGQECRFCQQCSRFHDLSEFDQKKRSCRRRLSDHNARRRKPQPKIISFNSSRLSSSFYDDRQQMNLLLSQVPFDHTQSITSSIWEDSVGFACTQIKESQLKSTKAGGIDRQLHLPGSELLNNISTLHHDLDKLFPFKGTTAEVLSQGLGASVVASSLDGAPDLRRALSLLSTDSLCSAEAGPISHTRYVSVNNTTAARPAMHAVDTSPGFWEVVQPVAQHTQVLPFDLQSDGGRFQEIQLLKTPYEATLFDSSQMH